MAGLIKGIYDKKPRISMVFLSWLREQDLLKTLQLRLAFDLRIIPERHHP